MDALTAKTNEIRRLHAVCRAQYNVILDACAKQVREARQYHHEAMRLRRDMRTVGHYADKHVYYDFCLNIDLRQQAIYAARVLKDVLTKLEG